MNILVTGASGYTGYRLCHALAESDDVFAVVRKADVEFKQKNIQVIMVDLEEDLDFNEVFPSNIDIVIHLAQSREYRNFPDGASDMYSINVDSTHRLLEWGRSIDLKQFVFTSTGNVYAKSESALIENSKCDPDSFYSVTKYSAELMCKMYASHFQVKILRVFGIYGPGQEGMLVPNIFNMVKNRKEISLASGIGLKFTPIYIDDAVRCLQKLLLKNDLSDFEILNLCGDEIIGLIDLVQKLETYLCVETKKVNTNLEYTSLIGDNSKLRRFIDDPFVCFEEGLKLTFFKMMGR